MMEGLEYCRRDVQDFIFALDGRVIEYYTGFLYLLSTL